jgi:hypothetical protein
MPFTIAGLRRGLLAGLPFILSNGVAGIVMGVAYRGLGLDFAAAVLFSLLDIPPRPRRSSWGFGPCRRRSP